MQKQGRMGWGISIHQYNSRQEKYQKRFLPWDFQTEWNQTKENCIWKCVVSHNNDSTLKVLSLAVLLSCPCMAPRGSFKHHLSYLGSWNIRFLVSREAPDTPRKYSLFSWMFSILLYHFWGRFDLLVACRIQDRNLQVEAMLSSALFSICNLLFALLTAVVFTGKCS